MSLSVSALLGVSSLPFNFPALHLLFRDGKRLADSIVEAFGFGLAGDGRGWKRFHFIPFSKCGEDNELNGF